MNKLICSLFGILLIIPALAISAEERPITITVQEAIDKGIVKCYTDEELEGLGIKIVYHPSTKDVMSGSIGPNSMDFWGRESLDKGDDIEVMYRHDPEDITVGGGFYNWRTGQSMIIMDDDEDGDFEIRLMVSSDGEYSAIVKSGDCGFGYEGEYILG
jgi:hypothetical protein